MKRVKAARILGLVLLLAAAFKLFIHDLRSLGMLYKAGSCFGMAACLILIMYLNSVVKIGILSRVGFWFERKRQSLCDFVVYIRQLIIWQHR